ncbi:MAG: hypothetical protein JWM88_996 [Verrucomicrobia bacterium]|nr:hypothetical protein [Verrucomicrobiota bacterium]
MISRKFLLLAILGLKAGLPGAAAEPIALGDRRALFVDDFLIARRDGLELRLHEPRARETVMVFDAPWEGSGSDFQRLIRVGDTIRMYYMATQLTSTDGKKLGGGAVHACYVESKDGVHWTRPDVGLFEFGGSRRNNIVWAEPKLDNFTPFLDSNPDCPADERFKAMSAGADHLLFGFKSPDGVHWSRISEQPLITHGKFDTQNNAFWDAERKQYWCYLRGFHTADGEDVQDTKHGVVGIRDIRVATSRDFRHWSEPRILRFDDSPDEALYTNQVEPYYRAPEIFVGFPTRYVDRPFSPAAMQALPDPEHRKRRMSFTPRYGTVVTDGQFMTSRDGVAFHRWDETFLLPGPERSNNWVYGDGYQSLGLVETPAEDPTSARELSFYADEGHWKEGESLRRYTIRIDGFVSLHARQKPGELVTPPLVFSGRRLSLNFATTAAGSVRVELQDADGHPLPGFALADCDELFGDTLDRTVTWHNQGAVESCAGRPVRIRVAMREADLYSLRFVK